MNNNVNSEQHCRAEVNPYFLQAKEETHGGAVARRPPLDIWINQYSTAQSLTHSLLESAEMLNPIVHLPSLTLFSKALSNYDQHLGLAFD